MIMNTKNGQAMHQTKNKKNTSPMCTFKPTPKEPSRTLHSFPSGGSAPSALPSFNLPPKDVIFGKTRSKSFTFNPYRVRDSNWSPTTTQMGLEVVGDLSRATNTNKNLLLRPLVTTQLPVINHHWTPPLSPTSPDGAHSSGLCSKVGSFLLQSFCTRVPKVVEPSQEKCSQNGIRIRMSSDGLMVDDHPNSPRKKAKISEDNDVEESFVVVKRDDFPIYPSSSFMNYCFGCHKRLEQNEDIYIFRGEMAFCSIECREKEMFIEEKMQRMKRVGPSSSTSRVIARKPTIQDLHKG